MKLIDLQGKWGTGLQAMVSDEDYEQAMQFKWTVKPRKRYPNLWYVRTFIDSKELYLHRFILGDKKGYMIDHIDRNALNNTRENLRHVSSWENNLNQATSNLSQYVGTTKKGKKYQSIIRRNNKIYYLGVFTTPEEANAAYLKKHEEIVGSPLELLVSNKEPNDR